MPFRELRSALYVWLEALADNRALANRHLRTASGLIRRKLHRDSAPMLDRIDPM